MVWAILEYNCACRTISIVAKQYFSVLLPPIKLGDFYLLTCFSHPARRMPSAAQHLISNGTAVIHNLLLQSSDIGTDLPERAGELQQSHCDIELLLSWPRFWEEDGKGKMSGTTFPIILSQAHFSLSVYNPDVLGDTGIGPSHCYGRQWSQVLGTMAANSKGFCSVVQLLTPHVLFLFSHVSHSHCHAGLNLNAFICLHEEIRVKCYSYRGKRGMTLWNTLHFHFLPPLCSSPPSSWICPWRIQIPLLYYTPKPRCQQTHSPGAPSPRELNSSSHSFWHLQWLPLEEYSGEQNFLIPHSARGLSHEVSWLLLQVAPRGPPSGRAVCLVTSESGTDPHMALPASGTPLWKHVDLWKYFGKIEKLKKKF